MSGERSEGATLRERLRQLHEARWARQEAARDRTRPRGPTSAERCAILLKADGRCHMCGGSIESGERWEADHVLAHSAGGRPSVDNYPPAHRLCNNYRWDYAPEEFQLILKLGVWIRTQIERGSAVGLEAAQAFENHEKARIARRRKRA